MSEGRGRDVESRRVGVETQEAWVKPKGSLLSGTDTRVVVG